MTELQNDKQIYIKGNIFVSHLPGMDRRIESGRNWVITVQAPQGTDENWKMVFPEKWLEKINFRAYVYEKGLEASTIHCHTILRFINVRRSNQLAKDLMECNKNSEIDVQMKRGTWKSALEYIEKQDATKINGRPPVIIGEIPREYKKINENGKETKEEEAKNVVDIVKEQGLLGLIEEKPESLLRFPNGCKTIKELLVEKSEKRTMRVTVIWGAAGVGKSTWASQEARKRWDEDDIYFFTKVGGGRDTIWFNGYNGQRCIIMDDISGRTMPFEYMLKILGNDPVDVEIKGGREPARWEEVIITSNYNPLNWYAKIWEDNEDSREAFFRRINTIINVTKNEDGVVWHLEKDSEVKKMRTDFTIEPDWSRTPRWIREERRYKEERILMKDEDKNVTSTYRYEEEEEEIEKSGIGIMEPGEITEETPDTPRSEMYWGGGDTFYLNYGPLKKGRMMAEMEKRMAFDAFVEKFNSVRRANGAAELSKGAIKAAIKDGRLKYNEKEWMEALAIREEIRRTHDLSEEEWSPATGYHDHRHEEEEEDLYDLVRNWSGEKEGQSFNSQWYEHEHIEEIE